ncbi:FtsK/SpoIIIE domain-containing protein [Staphylococcus gallinarum]|uniref:FtsK/SpoIIIE domain-containing protein n=1 Tax=Staphylococcus gallinarum TaxID=1293 RepID=UPI002DB70BA0|nr:FtsK/SpoIIIE domain-containing protein [Staphylococcus gallinarum]MEB6279078.1 hypothetical protein [Staphylococcus gallinarum]
MKNLRETIKNIKVNLKAKNKKPQLTIEGIDNVTFPLDLFESKQSKMNIQYERAKVYSERLKYKIENLFKDMQIDATFLDTHIAGVFLVYKYKVHEYVSTEYIEKIKMSISKILGFFLLPNVSMLEDSNEMAIVIPLTACEENYCVPIDNKLLFGRKNIDNANEMIMGLTIENELLEYNIDDYRNMLVVGQAGCGKTTWFDQILMSMMSRNSPSDIKIGLIDFSGSQYIGYDGLPYMLTDVVSDIDKVKMLLERINKEVDYRYKTFIENNVENIQEYNDMESKSDKPKFAKWTIVIEEIHQVKQQNEDVFQLLVDLLSKIHSISNVGIHFIVSLQTPKIITEELKQSFDLIATMRLFSSIDSEKILGEKGAESLNTKGDILLKYDGSLVRLQSSYISDTEKLTIFDYLKKNK